MHTKLEIVVETEKEKTQRKEFVFNDTKVSRTLHTVVLKLFVNAKNVFDWFWSGSLNNINFFF